MPRGVKGTGPNSGKTKWTPEMKAKRQARREAAKATAAEGETPPTVTELRVTRGKRPTEAPTKLELAQSAEITDLNREVENLAMRVADEQLKREAAEQEAVEWRGIADQRGKHLKNLELEYGSATRTLASERSRREIAEKYLADACSERDRARGYIDALLDVQFPPRPVFR